MGNLVKITVLNFLSNFHFHKAIKIRIFNLVLKILSCLLYIAEVESLRIKATKSDFFTPETTTNNCTDINWQKILYVDRFQNFSMIKKNSRIEFFSIILLWPIKSPNMFNPYAILILDLKKKSLICLDKY